MKILPTVAVNSATFSIAQLNLWNFFDTVDNPTTYDTVVTKKEYTARLRKLALTITTELKSPDIISLNEIENQEVLNDLLKLPEIKKLGYKGQVSNEPNDGRGISLGVLYRDNFEIVNIDEPNPRMSFKTDYAKGQINPELLYARAPLAIDFRYTGANQGIQGVKNLTVIINHFKSKLGGDGPEPRRQMQGQYLGEYVDKRLEKNPDANIVVIGDLNAFYEDGAYKKLAYRPDGSERLRDALSTLSDSDRYTYLYRGKKNLLDHIMATGKMFDRLASVTIPHINTVRGASKYRLDPKVATGISDHDPAIATFYLS